MEERGGGEHGGWGGSEGEWEKKREGWVGGGEDQRESGRKRERGGWGVGRE